MIVQRPPNSLLLHPLLSYAVQTPADSHSTSNQRDYVSVAVTDAPVQASFFTTVHVRTVIVECLAVDEVEQISGDHWSHRHGAPDARVSCTRSRRFRDSYQLMPIPLGPKASATSAGYTPKSTPYPNPVKHERTYSWFGFSIRKAATCAPVNMTADMTNIQKRDESKRLITMSDPTPDESRPRKEKADRSATCVSCRCWMKSCEALSSQCLQRVRAYTRSVICAQPT